MFEGIHDVRHMSSKMSVNVDHKDVSCIEWVRQEEKRESRAAGHMVEIKANTHGRKQR